MEMDENKLTDVANCINCGSNTIDYLCNVCGDAFCNDCDFLLSHCNICGNMVCGNCLETKKDSDYKICSACLEVLWAEHRHIKDRNKAILEAIEELKKVEYKDSSEDANHIGKARGTLEFERMSIERGKK
jgi:hypothetical protein